MGVHQASRGRLPDAGRAAGRRHHAVPQDRRLGGARWASASARTSPWNCTYILRPCYPTEPWVEHFEWLEPLFNEKLETRNGRMIVPTRPGLGLTLSDRVAGWTAQEVEVGSRA